MRNPASHIPRTVWILIAFAAVATIVVALFDWNWLRGPTASYLSAKFGRPVTIHGNLRGEFSLKPLLIIDDVTLANASWGSDATMARVEEIAVRVDLLSLFGPAVSLQELTLVRPVLLLERDPEGHENWHFGGISGVPHIGRLHASNGEVALISWGGDASELAIVLTNLDLARAVELLLRGDANSPVRCVVGNLVSENGVMDAR